MASYFSEKTFLNENYSSDLDSKYNLDDFYYTSGVAANDFTARCAN